jgi:nickel superoxide dismutase
MTWKELEEIMKLARLLPAQTVYAHCDIPCGVYSAEPAKIAALAVLRMTEKMAALPDFGMKTADDHNNFIRMVQTKEHEAQACKEQILILWTDFFKPEHLEKFPKLHDMIWQTAKQCGLAKRTADIETAKKLVEMVNLVADTFKTAEADHAATEHQAGHQH